MEEKDKIYCGKCLHYDGDVSCKSPMNIIITDTWKERKEKEESTCKERNIGNDCSWYVPI